MTKKVFLTELKKKLGKLPKSEVKERLSFYSEIIDDKIEEGFSEEDAVADVGGIDEIAKLILSEKSIDIIADTVQTKKYVSPWQIVLLIVGSPVWFPILLSFIVVIWSLVIAVWAVEIPLYILSVISKYFLMLSVECSKFATNICGKCVVCIVRLFRG